MKNTFVYPAFRNNTSGIWYFCTNQVKEFRNKKPCKGFGQIKYDEGSIYTGEIFFDGVNFNKLGYGQQDFSNSSLGKIDDFVGEKIYKYVGLFDYRKTDWIYGNGVFYYKDKDNRPTHFVKGFYRGLNRVKRYDGEFDYSLLLNGYSKDMEFDYNQREAIFEKEKSQLSDINTLFIGDSYFEFWNYNEYTSKSFYEFFTDKCLNLGLGGSTFLEWLPFINGIKDYKHIKNIVINLGFNDLHSDFSHKAVYRHCLKMLRLLRTYYPNANYYLLNVVHAPNFDSFQEEEKLYNELIEKTSRKNNVKILDNYSNIKNGQEKENCFHSDKVHLNSKGYELFYKLIKGEIDL